jgi:enoyl-CoA hydratase/long-chain 3-hydroxyacyl-CoA dehydrogenase
MSASRILGAVCHLARHGAPWLRGSPHYQAFSSSTAMAARVHLQLESKDGVGVVKFDSPDSKVNTLSEAVMNEFKEILQEVEKDNSIKSVVLISGKPDCFIAGADIGMLQSCKSAAEVENISQEGQNMLKYVAEFPKPVVGAIMGSCLGGGMEVALATHYRIAVKDSKTQLGVPEVLLGLLPGAGGTQRLPKTVSLTNAFDMMLTGRNIRPDKAKKMGLVDAVVDSWAWVEESTRTNKRLFGRSGHSNS